MTGFMLQMIITEIFIGAIKAKKTQAEMYKYKN